MPLQKARKRSSVVAAEAEASHRLVEARREAERLARRVADLEEEVAVCAAVGDSSGGRGAF